MSNTKKKAGLSLTQECLDLLEINKEMLGFKSKNELAEEAIKFYVAYMNASNNTDYLSKSMTNGARDAIKNAEDRMARLAYKIAVELAQINIILTEYFDFSYNDASELRSKAVRALKLNKGMLSLDRAVRLNNLLDL